MGVGYWRARSTDARPCRYSGRISEEDEDSISFRVISCLVIKKERLELLSIFKLIHSWLC